MTIIFVGIIKGEKQPKIFWRSKELFGSSIRNQKTQSAIGFNFGEHAILSENI